MKSEVDKYLTYDFMVKWSKAKDHFCIKCLAFWRPCPAAQQLFNEALDQWEKNGQSEEKQTTITPKR